ncbi:hypothetical protein [Rugamonas sp.]|uniref:hypothetical protein n=1 Tax=Rugamonas sp. TaxID=1926287 RepID=UPI0025FD2C23|nr:hypothetical protein [Rugamonas sp.]
MTSTIDATAFPGSDLLEQLNEIANLTDDWDGYGAAAIDEGAISHARAVLPGLTILPDAVLPSVAGTVLMEWEAALGVASLELGRELFSFYTSPTTGTAILLEGAMREFNVEDINFAVATVAASPAQNAMENRN